MTNGTRPASHREILDLPVGFEDPKSGQTWKEAEVRAVTAGDELFIGTSPDYNRHPNDLVYKTLLLSRCVVRVGQKTPITLDDVRRFHAQDVRLLEYAIYRLTYGVENVPEPDAHGVTVAYPLAQVRTEVAFIAYHFHWELQTILDLPHRERVEWVGHISQLNQKIIDSAK